MAVARDSLDLADDNAHVVLADRTIAALSQLNPAEREAVLDALQALRTHGLGAESGLIVDRLGDSVGTCAISLEDPAALRLIVRQEPDGSIVVLNIFRAETLRSLFHAS